MTTRCNSWSAGSKTPCQWRQIEKLAVVRIDGDLYESTLDAITALYPKLSIGGYLIVDDYNDPHWTTACRQAIDDYRTTHEITEPIQEIDWTGVYWRRER